MKKPPKPRLKKAQRAISPSNAKAAPQPPQEEVRRPFLGALGRIVAIVGGAGTVLTLLGAIFNWWPHITVEASAAPDLVAHPRPAISRSQTNSFTQSKT